MTAKTKAKSARAPKPTERKTTPGLRRLRAAPNAEAIRTETLADQKRARREARAKIEAASAPKTPAEAPLAAEAPKAKRGRGKPASAHAKAPGARAAIIEAAEAGVIPAPPNFEAATHARFRGKLAEVVAMVERSDVEALASYEYRGFLSSSPKAIVRFKDLALTALRALAAKAAAA